jgi:hypothetical protein
LKGQKVNTQANLPTGNVFSMDWSTGKLVPITAAGLLPVGAVVTYEDRANPRRRYVVTAAAFDQYGHGQNCTCEDGHRSQVSRSAINGPGGWSDTGEVLDAAGVAAFLASAATEGARLKAEHEQAEAVRLADHTQRRAEAIAKHPHLERVPAGGYSSAKLAAKNIRTELKAAFPGVKFSVTSETFSGGDAVDIGWELGPTTKQVEAITGKYQEGSFNGMEDIYETNRENIWPDIFGGAKYVSENRSEAGALDIIAAGLCDKWSLPKPADGKMYAWKPASDEPGGRELGNLVHELMQGLGWDIEGFVAGLATAEIAPENIGLKDTAIGLIKECLSKPAVRQLLSEAPQGVTLWQERKAALIHEGKLISAVFDRVHVIPGHSATVIDFKTNDCSLEHLKELYQGQMDLYRVAVAKLCGLEVGKVRCVLVHVRAGALVEC